MAFTPDTHELAWAAGLFDGEGCVRFRRGGTTKTGKPRYRQAALDLAQVDRAVLDRFQSAVGCGRIYGPYKSRNAKHRPHYVFAGVSHANIQAIVAMLWKWLSPVKRAQATKALMAWRNDPRPGRWPTKEAA